MLTTCLASFTLMYCLAVSSIASSQGSSSLDFKMTIYHGHVYVTWTVEKEFLQSNVPINYTINYCPVQINRGVNTCDNVIAVCRARYVRSEGMSEGDIQGYPNNIEKYLTKQDYEEMDDTIETIGPLVEGKWHKEKKQFTCGIFLHRCMDGQFYPNFVYDVSYNGTTTHVYSQKIHFNAGPAAKAENISIQEQRHVGCCSVNVIINWKILHVCRVDVPDFIVWLTVGDKTISKKTIENTGVKIYSFERMFEDLQPSTQHTVHIESFKSLENRNKTYVNKSFSTPAIKVQLNATETGERGFLFINWTIEKRILNNSMPIIYNISWCPQQINPPPHTDKNCSTMCSAVYNSSQTYIKLHKENLQKYEKYIDFPNRTFDRNQSLINGMYDKKNKQFRCRMFLNPCRDYYRSQIFVRFDMKVNGVNLLPETRQIDFNKGFFINPENLTTTPEFTATNTLNLTVAWRFRQICSPEVATQFSIWITTENVTDRRGHPFRVFDGHQISLGSTTYLDYKWTVNDLRPHTLYTLHIETSDDWVTKKHMKRQVLTPEGVPDASPTIESVTPSVCRRNRRNGTIRWNMPPEKRRNGIIRTINLVYWGRNHRHRTNLSLDNVTSWELFGLRCDVQYHVKVRACIGKNKCSEYSRVVVIEKAILNTKTSKKLNVGFLVLAICGGGVVAILLFAFSVWQWSRHNRKPKLPQARHENVDRYSRPDDDRELSHLGEYNRLADEFVL